ncbi:hypothetical protein SADUNF_Sadunf08G0128500 [Salix dunnii]|uniref:NADP-dependent oxidoreductase domain-containing protein n=1 Tax=Salix dunnii TaxID=1413687 RepID=A0A835K2V9_9ROSI|nr:hypothetical protein SADUNF_Sadunf08G0128500 [Salix dunnii]
MPSDSKMGQGSTKMATSAVMQTVLATPVAGSPVKNQSRVCHLFPATYVPRLRGGAGKRVQCKAELDDQKSSAERNSARNQKASRKFSEVFAFSGPAPERINGRLAMIGFVSAMAVELSKGQDLLSQISNGGASWFVGTSILLSVASLIPLFKGVSAEFRSEGVMTSDAEMVNGRFAMLGLALTQFPREKIQLATKFAAIRLEGFRFTIKLPQNMCGNAVKLVLSALVWTASICFLASRGRFSSNRGYYLKKKLVQEGKIQYVGLSEASADTRAHAVHPITAVEMECSLWSREIEEDIILTCLELGIGTVAYSPLGRGFFAGKAVVESLPNESIQFSGENIEKNKVIYARISDLAAKHACTPPQLTLACLLHQGEDEIPIPGTASRLP